VGATSGRRLPGARPRTAGLDRGAGRPVLPACTASPARPAGPRNNYVDINLSCAARRRHTATEDHHYPPDERVFQLRISRNERTDGPDAAAAAAWFNIIRRPIADRRPCADSPAMRRPGLTSLVSLRCIIGLPGVGWWWRWRCRFGCVVGLTIGTVGAFVTQRSNKLRAVHHYPATRPTTETVSRFVLDGIARVLAALRHRGLVLLYVFSRLSLKPCTVYCASVVPCTS